MALTSGTKLGSYEIVALLGAGGMGEVYRARATRLDRDVAVKGHQSDGSRRKELMRRTILSTLLLIDPKVEESSYIDSQCPVTRLYGQVQVCRRRYGITPG